MPNDLVNKLYELSDWKGYKEEANPLTAYNDIDYLVGKMEIGLETDNKVKDIYIQQIGNRYRGACYRRGSKIPIVTELTDTKQAALILLCIKLFEMRILKR